MDQRLTDQLDKILALVDSSYEREAMVAVRKARQLLSKDGLNFSDLARGISSQKARTPNSDADYWRRRAEGFEKNLILKTREAERWRKLAEETADKLWNLGLAQYAEPAKKTVFRSGKAR